MSYCDSSLSMVMCMGKLVASYKVRLRRIGKSLRLRYTQSYSQTATYHKHHSRRPRTFRIFAALTIHVIFRALHFHGTVGTVNHSEICETPTLGARTGRSPPLRRQSPRPQRTASNLLFVDEKLIMHMSSFNCFSAAFGVSDTRSLQIPDHEDRVPARLVHSTHINPTFAIVVARHGYQHVFGDAYRIMYWGDGDDSTEKGSSPAAAFHPTWGYPHEINVTCLTKFTLSATSKNQLL